MLDFKFKSNHTLNNKTLTVLLYNDIQVDMHTSGYTHVSLCKINQNVKNI